MQQYSSYSDSVENWDLFDAYPPHIREESFIQFDLRLLLEIRSFFSVFSFSDVKTLWCKKSPETSVMAKQIMFKKKKKKQQEPCQILFQTQIRDVQLC